MFGLDSPARCWRVIRTDGATFAKLEIYDVATGKPTTSFDLPGTPLLPASLEPLPDGSGAVLVARERPDDAAPVFAFGFASGKPVVKVGPTAGFERPPADGTPRAEPAHRRRPQARQGGGGDLHADAVHLRDAGPRRQAERPTRSTLPASSPPRPFRFLGFFDGYTRILGERPGAYDKSADVRKPPRMVVVDALTGKVLSEGEIADVLAGL